MNDYIILSDYCDAKGIQMTIYMNGEHISFTLKVTLKNGMSVDIRKMFPASSSSQYQSLNSASRRMMNDLNNTKMLCE
jgi:hypothetical protein